ncbi:MAG: VTT domain-containing protein [SAR202 cluster bacterium]|nr:VTT domain-containing protein [SAR202 cluster bacterium]
MLRIVRANLSITWLVAHRNGLITTLILAAVAGYVLLVTALWVAGSFEARTIGYPGVWLFSLIGASAIFLPIPGLAAVCAAAAPSVGLNPALLGVIAGSAEAIGELTGYLAGAGGGTFVQKNRHFPRVRKWVMRRGGLVFFAMSLVPNPLFDVAGIAAGSVRYPVRQFLLFTFLGKTIKSTWLAYGCYYGISAIQGLVG